ncbi:hypothetical protein KL942_003638 [Ogataea angusta]|uniref:C2H2-type domain-containing protein n=1 Tax=Pichia angusta TaxID=870730 RepID=A0AAN6DEQ2_PICAN|nr:uncharacterized protein KL928_003974 [Ogataea angusta]KAG7817239.1 hypothetical protein KL928_003974 [Ogataea angusta]KAG7823557.1 hypothetical protein KL909_002954 [Ogataea angusta]KAG7828744.1 hypothetical protein KL920_003240 [Ogataea angusta]KAG7833265.1 hypothetical protein KL943_004130 [Ogataea angusta]KAG7839276.1 hypothetical protein KL942_003638 [Ogataea angusta]
MIYSSQQPDPGHGTQTDSLNGKTGSKHNPAPDEASFNFANRRDSLLTGSSGVPNDYYQPSNPTVGAEQIHNNSISGLFPRQDSIFFPRFSFDSNAPPGSFSAASQQQPPEGFPYSDIQREYSFAYPPGSHNGSMQNFLQPYSSERAINPGSADNVYGRRPSEQLEPFITPQQQQQQQQQAQLASHQAQYQLPQAGAASRNNSHFFRRFPSISQPNSELPVGDVDSFLKRDSVNKIFDQNSDLLDSIPYQDQQQQQPSQGQQHFQPGHSRPGSMYSSAPVLPIPTRMVTDPAKSGAQSFQKAQHVGQSVPPEEARKDSDDAAARKRPETYPTESPNTGMAMDGAVSPASKKAHIQPSANLVPVAPQMKPEYGSMGNLVPANQALHTEDGRPLIGATKVDQLMLVIQARKKGLTGDIRQAEDGTILEEVGPRATNNSVLPNPVELVGGVEKPNIRGHKQHQCQYCYKKFTQSTHLEVHIRSHIGLKPYECSFCHKRFTQGGNLRTHLRLHTGEKPFKCEVCDKSFSRKGNLQAHMLTHNNLRPFVCKFDNCNKSFTQLGNLKAHQNRFHMKTLNELTNKLAHISSSGNSIDALPPNERDLLLYFADLYKNLNRGIRGRGRGVKNSDSLQGTQGI